MYKIKLIHSLSLNKMKNKMELSLMLLIYINRKILKREELVKMMHKYRKSHKGLKSNLEAQDEI